MALRVPATVIKAKCARPTWNASSPPPRPPRKNLGDHDIVAAYGAKYQGISQ